MDNKVKEALRLARKIEVGEKEEFTLVKDVSLVLENKGNNKTDAILKFGESSLDLSDFVPERKVQFELGNSFSIQYTSPPIVVIAIQELRKSPKRVLSLFHEIGHAITRASQSEEDIKELELATQNMNDAVMQWRDVNKVLTKRESSCCRRGEKSVDKCFVTN